MLKRISIAAMLGFAVILVVSCGGEGPKEAASTPSAAVVPRASPTTVPTAPPTTVPTAPPPAEPAASDLVEGDLTALPAGAPGKVSILAVGPLQSGASVPVVARNNTTDSIIKVHLTGTARGPDGALLASGEDQGTHPTVVRPGEIVFGYIYFSEGAKFPDGTQYEISASWHKGDSDDSNLGLQIAEINKLEDRIVGILKNPYAQKVNGPISVDVICFDESGHPISTVSDFADQDSVSAGGTASFQVKFYGGSCPRFLLAADGYGY